MESFEHYHHTEMVDDHVSMENDHEDKDNYDNESKDHEMIESSESVLTIKSVVWEMKIPNKNDCLSIICLSITVSRFGSIL